MPPVSPNRDRLVNTFLRLVRVDSPSRGEATLAQLLRAELTALGWNVSIDAGGNLIAILDGNPARETVLFASHMDVVSPCRGVQPQLEDGYITSNGATVLGADAKASIAALLELAALLQGQPEHPRLEIICTWGEEIGHLGAKAIDLQQLRAKQAWVLDALVPAGTIVVAAPSYYSFVARIHGRAAHAGVEPERGISAITVAAKAISRLEWGRLDAQTTANVGTIRGGSVRNAVPAEVELEGEVRSLSAERASEVVARIKTVFTDVAREAGAELDLQMRLEYSGYTLAEDEPLVLRARQAFEALQPGSSQLVATGGGSDANEFNARGLRACVLGIGAEACHSVAERISIEQLDLLTRWVHQIVELA